MTSEWLPCGGEEILPWGNIANLVFSDNRVVLEFSETEFKLSCHLYCVPVDGFLILSGHHKHFRFFRKVLLRKYSDRKSFVFEKKNSKSVSWYCKQVLNCVR